MHSVVVGVILGPHGIRGGMRLLPLSDVPERFSSMKDLNLYRKNGEFVCHLPLSSVRLLPGKSHILAFSPLLNTPEEVQALKGLEIRVSREDRPPLEEGEFWVEDLLGLQVVDADTEEMYGVLSQVITTGASDVYVLKTSAGKERMFPAVRSVILKVDPERNIITIRPPEGLWD
ncbi:MAG TPA: ribosome maturation factor RimM [Synergistaceae bacterium]|nr:ribosome maturation factor RimM [Synergistaceae bacterium]HPQ36147.1 ribosome maturation factor RimM [Synergistaceae bacterium]